jgi:hypothetical protein
VRGLGWGLIGLSALYWGVTSPVIGTYLGSGGVVVATFLRRLSDPTVPGIWQHHPGAITSMGPLTGGGGGGSPAHYQPATGPVPPATNPVIRTV